MQYFRSSSERFICLHLAFTKIMKVYSVSHSLQMRILRLTKVKKCSPSRSIYLTTSHQSPDTSLFCLSVFEMRSKTAPSAPFHGFIFMDKCSPSKKKEFFL